MMFESDYSFLNLSFVKSLKDSTVLWIIGEYVQYVEEEVVLKNRKVNREDLLHHLRTRKLECANVCMDALDFIPGLYPSGIG